MDQKKYEDAIAHLEEDQDNPFTLELLVQAYYQTMQTDKLHEVEAKLRGTNVPTIEQALVVPAFAPSGRICSTLRLRFRAPERWSPESLVQLPAWCTVGGPIWPP